ncbi:GAF domain-containing protein (plasmid) [Methylobacterium sp. NMS12]|uniref:GAF domain-containing protein n=1 Tax=Methylobacterium sp. NMS12 TaxID=3079766 RepID=UPI003F8847F5
MQPDPSSPVLDPARLTALDALSILDTLPEQGFDDIVRLATRLCATPVALVSLVAADRQWFKARVGFPHCETDLDRSVCKFALPEPDLLVIPDLTADPRTAANPLVTDDPHIRFYAGAPLRTPEGHVLGSLCVIDTVPRPAGLTREQADDLRALSRQVTELLSMRRAVEHRDAVLDLQRDRLRRNRHLDVLARASQALLNAEDPAAVLDPILSASAGTLGFDRSYTYDLWPDGEALRLTHSLNATADVEDFLRRLPLGAPLCGIVAERRQPLVLAGLQGSGEEAYANARAIGLDAYAGYPLMSRGTLRGVISFASTQRAVFDEETLTFFATVARLMSAVYERLDGERALRDSDRRSRLAQEAGGIGTFELAVDTGRMSVSPVLARLFGVPPTGLYTAETLEARILPEDRANASTHGTRRDGTATADVRYRIRRADDGALRWIARRADFVRDPDGRVVQMFGTVQDVTERHVAEDALKAGEAHWRGLFERLSEGFIVGEVIRDAAGVIRDWRYVDVNAAWGELVGVDPTTVIGRTVREVFPGIEDAWVDEFADVVSTGEPVTFTRQVGTLARWYEGRAFPLADERFGVIFMEITDRVQAEARRSALIALSDRLRDLTGVDEMTLITCEILGTTLGAMLVGYGDVDPQRESITVERDWTTGGATTLAGTLNFRDYGSYIEDLKRGETVIVRDCRTDPRTREHAGALEERSARAFVNTPVFERGAFVALLYVSTARPRDWNGPELAFIRDVASRLRLAVARVRAEERQDLLNHELSHRLKNTLAVVQSIAGQTLRSIPEREPVEAFERRIMALSRAHDVLLQDAWSAASLRAVAANVLGPHAAMDRFVLSGPEIALAPSAVLSLSLLLHELATNAAKYGALSAVGGTSTCRGRCCRVTRPLSSCAGASAAALPPSSRRGAGSARD